MALPASQQHPAPAPAWWHALGAGLVHAALMAAAAPPWSIWPLALLSLLPLAWAGVRTRKPWRDSLLVFIGVLPLWAFWQWWVIDVSAAGWAPLSCAVTLFSALFVRLLASARAPSWLAVPCLWTGLEFFRGEIAFDGYAWGFPAHPLIDSAFLASPAAVGGVYLVTLLLAAASGAVLDLALHRGASARSPLLVLAAVTIVFALCSLLRPDDASGRWVRVAAVQTNIPQNNKMGWTIEQEFRDFQRFQALTREAADKSPAIIAWPETMMPGLTLEPDALRVLRDNAIVFRLGEAESDGEIAANAFADGLTSLQRELGVPMLVGEEARTALRVQRTERGLSLPFEHRYNSVYMVSSGALAATRYDKLRLTPFGETMPYFRAIPGLQQKLLDFGAAGMAFDLTEGTHRTVFEVPSPDGAIRVVTPICFESTVASLNRTLVFDDASSTDVAKRIPLSPAARRADLIVNVTNDGWFGASVLGRLQHLQAARWRSLENNTPTLRVANTGVSAVIDARGRIVASGVDGASGAAMVEGVLTAQVRLGAGVPLFARVGDTFGWLSLLGAFALMLRARWTARTSARPRANVRQPADSRSSGQRADDANAALPSRD